MAIAVRLILTLWLGAIEATRAVPAFRKMDYTLNSSLFDAYSSLTLFQIAIGSIFLNVTAAESSSTVLAIRLPAPPSLQDGPAVLSTSIIGTITITTTALASTVTVPLLVPPETITNTVVITLPPSIVSPTSSAIPSSSLLISTLPSPTSSSFVAAPSSSAHLPNLDGLAIWTAPKQLKDLDPFNITSFPGSQNNLKIITGMPAKASASPNRISPAKAVINTDDDDNPDEGGNVKGQNLGSLSLPPLTTWDSKSTSLQLLYPANSINPAQKPQGGAEFYASPLDISAARNVSMRFSVYFPLDFDWVLAGKLPGLYGGHTGCSGGNAALDCFSTRLMWREKGAGELYLYAAKDKQTEALCADPRSVCDAAYGFSIGRGSFTWAAGAWTTVTQTVVLNTPGKQDGAFILDVNGKRVIEKSGVFYRDVLWPAKNTAMSSDKGRTSRMSTTMKENPAFTSRNNLPLSSSAHASPAPTPTTTQGHDDDPLGDILGPLLSEIGNLIRRSGTKTSVTLLPAPSIPLTTSPTLSGVDTNFSGSTHNPAPTAIHKLKGMSSLERLGDNDDDDDLEEEEDLGESDVDDSNDPDPFTIQSTPQREGNSIGFIGIFFSTFFGGHDDKYATPTDQYAWFKDFAMSYNA